MPDALPDANLYRKKPPKKQHSRAGSSFQDLFYVLTVRQYSAMLKWLKFCIIPPSAELLTNYTKVFVFFCLCLSWRYAGITFQKAQHWIFSPRAHRVPVAKAMPKHVVNPVMARISSKLPAAISRVGMPCSRPYPSFCNTSMEGTTTAGDTAPRTKLKQGQEGLFTLFFLTQSKMCENQKCPDYT